MRATASFLLPSSVDNQPGLAGTTVYLSAADASLPGAEVARRPASFFSNGGHGSASVATNEPAFQAPLRAPGVPPRMQAP